MFLEEYFRNDFATKLGVTITMESLYRDVS